jgi:hypothetical protein
VFWVTLLVWVALISSSSAQTAFVTGSGDNSRTGANEKETLLMPSNVNKNSFGRLFSQPVDYQVLGQPLYVPNVVIPNKGIHNVVYVVSMLDSVYAFDADSNDGGNAVPLWQVSFLDPANGVTIASGSNLPCTNPNSNGPGFNQEGIVSTPVIDPNTGTLYVVAKTVENGTVRHRLHALDIGSGQEKFGGPNLISATSISNQGKRTAFNSLHQKNRPGLLLLNGVVYMAFGSNYCNDANTGWVLGYDAATLQQTGAFNTNPDHGLTSIWQSGHGIPADDAGNLFVETGEGNFDANVGGQGFGNSVIKLSTNPLGFSDYFTPSNVIFLNQHDLDLSSTGAVILPDQDGPHPHEVVATGKQGTIYLMDRDDMGQYDTQADMIVQEIPLAVGEMFSSPAYWNGIVYFCGNAGQLRAYSLSGGLLSTVPVAMTLQKLTGSHSPSISSNGDRNGILWVVNAGQLWAFDAITLKLLYNTGQVPLRDKLPKLAHFATQTVVNGRVYIATRNSLEVLGLFHLLSVSSGANQSATVLTALPAPIQVLAAHAYTGQPLPGVSVTFSDGGKGGTFNPPTAITDVKGLVSTTYTVPQKSGAYTITASAANFGNLTFTETALPGPAIRIIAYNGGQQTGPVGSVLPVPLTALAQDVYRNGVPGVSVTFDNGGKGAFLSPATVQTDSGGKAKVTYQLPNVPGKYPVKASSPGLKTVSFTEFAVVGPPAGVTITGGNNQAAPAGTPLGQLLSVVVADQYGNPVPSVAVAFDDGGAGGQFSNPNPVLTDNTGTSAQGYTLPPLAGTIFVTATATGVATPASFTETAH